MVRERTALLRSESAIRKSKSEIPLPLDIFFRRFIIRKSPEEFLHAMQNTTLRVFLTALTSAWLLSIFAAGVSAQRNPPMTSVQREGEKEMYYAQFLELKRVPTAEHQRLAHEAGKEYLKRFEENNDSDAHEVRKFVNEYEKVMREFEFYRTFSAGDNTKTVELGRQILQRHPESFFVLGILAEIGFGNSKAGDANANAETIDYARRAIKVLDAGKVTKPDPFKTIDVARGFLNVVVGSLLKDQSPVEAAQAFRNAVKSDSPYRSDALIYHRLGVAILKGEFAQLSAEYNEKYGNTKVSPEQQAMLGRLVQLGQRAIDAYARAVALSTKPEQLQFRTKVLEQLTVLYKQFHNSSDAGLNELIATVLTKPLH